MALGLPWSHVIKYHRWVAAVARHQILTLASQADRQAARHADWCPGVEGENPASSSIVCGRWMGHFTMLAVTVHGICYYVVWAFQPGVK